MPLFETISSLFTTNSLSSFVAVNSVGASSGNVTINATGKRTSRGRVSCGAHQQEKRRSKVVSRGRRSAARESPCAAKKRSSSRRRSSLEFSGAVHKHWDRVQALVSEELQKDNDAAYDAIDCAFDKVRHCNKPCSPPKPPKCPPCPSVRKCPSPKPCPPTPRCPVSKCPDIKPCPKCPPTPTPTCPTPKCPKVTCPPPDCTPCRLQFLARGK